MKKVAVVGGSGMVASRFIDLASKKFNIVSFDEKSLDITQGHLVDKYFSGNKFDVVVNFAAYTNVDGAEAQNGNKDGLVWRLNVGGARNLASACNKNNIFFVHISTDFVFPGTKENPGPYSENSRLPEDPDSIGWYGWTKNRAEHEVVLSGSRNAIVRYGFPFRADRYESKLDWARNLLKLYNEHKLYPLFSDRQQSLLFIDDLVAPLSKIIDGEIEGIFHIASVDICSPFEAGKYLLNQYFGRDIQIEKGSIKNATQAGKAPRPTMGGLRVEATEQKLGIEFKNWRQMIDEFVEQSKRDD